MKVIDIMNPPGLICIGRKGENVFREVPMDVSGFIKDHLNGTITAMYQSGENEPFPVVLEQDGTVFTWKPRAEEITDENGRIEVVLTDGEVVGATKIIECFVDESLIDGTEHPAESAPAWSVEMIQKVESAVSHYPKIVNGVWYVWSVQDEDYVSTGIEAQGEDGHSPTVTVTEIDGGHRVTITDADGAHTFDVMDGEDGEGGGTAADAVLYTPQTLTPAQQEQARENAGIEYLTANDIREMWYGAGGVPFEQTYEYGEVTSGGNSYDRFPSGSPTNRLRAKKEYIREVPLFATSVTVGISSGLLYGGKYKIGWAFYTENYAQIQSSIKGWYTSPTTFTADIPSNAVYYMIYIATVSNSAVADASEIDYSSASIVFNSSSTDYAKEPWYPRETIPADSIPLTENPFLFSVNHRGYSTEAPENTLPAFILSRKKGFRYVETDVLFTSDEVPVLLHDATINRTARNADGSEISETTRIDGITYEQALSYDFGIWKGSEYAGTKIPTFAEFIQLCKQLSITPLIELKNETTWTDARIESVAYLIEAVGMQDRVAFISFSKDALEKMSTHFPTALMGLGFQGTYSAANISTIATNAVSLKNGRNRVCVSLRNASMTDALFEIVESAGLTSFVWTVNSKRECASLHRNVVGVLSDSLIAGKIIEDAIING